MPNHGPSHSPPGPAPVYLIAIDGHLDDQWAAWFEGLTLTRAANGETRLTGPVVDQAALHRLLRKVRDLGLPLLTVMRLEPGPAAAPQARPNEG